MLSFMACVIQKVRLDHSVPSALESMKALVPLYSTSVLPLTSAGPAISPLDSVSTYANYVLFDHGQMPLSARVNLLVSEHKTTSS